MNASEVKAGTVATVKVGRNEVEVTIIEATANGWMVKSNSSGREFEVKKFERIVSAPATTEPESSESPNSEPVGSSEAAARVVEEESNGNDNSTDVETEADTPNPAPESDQTEKKLSLLDAAFQVLKQSSVPLNCKEIIKKAIEDGLWTPTAAKTPEQSLYSAMFREIKNKENSRFRKSDSRKGSFEFNR